MPWGFAFTTYVNGTMTGDDATKPQTAESALALPQLDVQNAGTTEENVTVRFTLVDSDGKQVVTASYPLSVPGGGWKRIAPGSGPFVGEPIGFGSAAEPVKLWNTADDPPLYLLRRESICRSDPSIPPDSGSVTDICSCPE